MITLIATVCMIDQAARCKDVQLVFEGHLNRNTSQCEMNGQIELAKWVGDHPNWIIKNFYCVSGLIRKA